MSAGVAGRITSGSRGAQAVGDLELAGFEGAAVLDVPEGVLEEPSHRPGTRACAVQAEDVGHGVEAPGDLVGVEAVVEGGPEVESGVAGEGLGVDGEPGGAVGGEDVLVV